MSTSIPDTARTAVKVRDHFRCARCLAPAPNGHWHHRRSRSVIDRHQHCACNGVWLCGLCHLWVHENPVKARATGFIVSKFETEPFRIPIENPLGVRFQDCSGKATY